VLACGFMADAVREVIGDGAALGVRVEYVEEPTPLGTGGALKYAEELLEDRFLMLNGDVLTDIDLSAQLEQHERTGARATLALVQVEDPSAYGLVRCASDGAVLEFLEKPGPGPLDTNLINAGAYVLERGLLSQMPPAGTKISIERDVFPMLVGNGLFGYVASGYWLDIGTPERYLQGTYDILEGAVQTELGARMAEASSILVEDAAVNGIVTPPALIQAGCEVAAGATIGDHTVLGPGVRVGDGTRIERSVALAGSTIGDGTTVEAAILAPGVAVGDRCRIEPGAVLGEGAVVGSGNVVEAGARIFPGVVLPEAIPS
jgi:mannose-1-phosphate guanylyltransferase